MILTYKFRIKDATAGKHLARHAIACNQVAEIASLRAQLDEARRKAIEDAAQKVERFYIAPKPTSRAAQFHERNVRAILAAEIRALLSESKT